MLNRRDGGIMRRPAESHLDEREWSMLLDAEALPADRLAHRTSCAACEREWRIRLGLSRALRHAAPAEMPPGLATRLKAALSDASNRGPAGPEALPGWLLWWGRPAGMLVAAVLLAVSILFAPRLAARAVALPNSWAWAAGMHTPQDPLASEWQDDTLVLPDAGRPATDIDGAGRPAIPVGRRHPPTERAS